jgi:O-antigen/teichoic acid export membrane protein
VSIACELSLSAVANNHFAGKYTFQRTRYDSSSNQLMRNIEHSFMVLRNTIWNLLGAGLPIAVAIGTIPVLVAKLGPERFGALAIGWAVMGYFALSDLGIGRATTKLLAEFDSRLDPEGAKSLFWTSAIAHIALGIIGGAAFAACVPLIAKGFSDVLQYEMRDALFWLAASIPILLATSCLRSVLEGRHRFDLVNAIKAPASTINFIVPWLTLFISQSVGDMMNAIFIGRTLVLLAHILVVFHSFPLLKQNITISLRSLRRLFEFGIWAAISSLINPVALFADRFFVASLFGMAAVTYYITPYEMVTKLWILSASLLGALYPLISVTDPRSKELKAISRKAFLFLVVSATPIVGFVLVFSRDLFSLWIDVDFAAQSGSVAKWLVLGVYINILAQVPFTVLQATGQVGAVARMQFVELPIFLALAWWLSLEYGTVGVAMAWAMRTLIDAAMLEWMARRWMGRSHPFFGWTAITQLAPISLFLMLAWLLESLFRDDFELRSIGFACEMLALIFWMWHKLFMADERANFIATVRGRFVSN